MLSCCSPGRWVLQESSAGLGPGRCAEVRGRVGRSRGRGRPRAARCAPGSGPPSPLRAPRRRWGWEAPSPGVGGAGAVVRCPVGAGLRLGPEAPGGVLRKQRFAQAGGVHVTRGARREEPAAPRAAPRVPVLHGWPWPPGCPPRRRSMAWVSGASVAEQGAGAAG